MGTRTTKQAEVAERIGSARRLTRQRLLVAEALTRERVALSAQELHERIRATRQHIGLATVYRALEAQVADGMATRLERPGHVYVYAPCVPEHHHHLVCTRCQRVEDLDETILRPVLRSIRDRHRFDVDHAQLDFYGLCQRCREQPAR